MLNRKVSGNYDSDDEDDEKPRRKGKATRVRKLAEEFSLYDVGNLDAVESYIAKAEGIINWDDLKAVLRRQGWEYVRTRTYRNDNGTPLYDCHRFVYWKYKSKKGFLLTHDDGEGRKVLISGPVRVPYNLPELLKRPDEDIDLVEGEDGAEACKDKLLATCVQGQNWTDDAAAPFCDRNVNVCMDNDDGGQEATRKAVEQLTKAGAATIKVPLLPGLGPRQGLDDWLKTHTVEECLEIVARTVPVHSALNVGPYNFPNEKDILTYDWLQGRHVLRGEVAGTAATGGTGKSNLSIIEALEETTGKQLLYGSGDGKKLRVVLINLEDNRNTMDKRIAAAMRHYGLTPEDVGGRLVVIAKGEIKIKIARQERGEVTRNESDIRKLIDIAIKHRADVVSIDSVVRTHKVNENDNSAVTQVIECYEEVAIGGSCGVHLWHHTRKGNGDGATVESARGAQAFIDACRSVRILETMTKKERDELSTAVPDMGQAGWYFREFNGKRNFAPPAEESKWFRYVSVEIDNARDFMTGGDQIGVVTPWNYPKLDLSAARTPVGRENALAAVGAGGPWRANSKSKTEPWVGVPIARALNLDLTDKRARSEVAKLVGEWLAAGLLRPAEGTDLKGNPREYIERA